MAKKKPKRKVKRKIKKKAKKKAKAKPKKKMTGAKVEILAGYVRSLHRSGYDVSEIKASLRKNGASSALIAAAIRKAGSKKSLRSGLSGIKKGKKKVKPKKPFKLFKKKKKIIKEVKKKKGVKFQVKKPKTKRTFQKKKLKPMMIFAILAILIILGISVLAMPKNCGRDLSCFMAEADKCAGAKYFADIDNAEVKFSTHGCRVEKRILEVDRDEPKEAQNLFTGMSMNCKYEKGEFSTVYTDRLSGGLETCTGKLADAITKLKTVRGTLE